jgi:lipopolysaccharide/colanic/teichoic acid biosynthesis glycosyltransferase
MRDRPIASRPSRLGPLARRVVDLVVLLLVAPVALALVAVLAVAVKLDSPGPGFVTHRRIGRGGREFRMLKVRTMVRNAEQMKAQLMDLNVLPVPDFKIPNDPRVTRVGRWLRKTSLDELPQLWNVLRGEMTLVGPRPCSIDVARYELWQTERLEVTPGLIGRWQAEGRNHSDFAARCRMDIRQLRTDSPAASLLLAAKTLKAMLTSRESF